MPRGWTHEDDRDELERLERQLDDVTAPSRQVPPTPAGTFYLKMLREDIAELRKRVAVSEDK